MKSKIKNVQSIRAIVRLVVIVLIVVEVGFNASTRADSLYVGDLLDDTVKAFDAVTGEFQRVFVKKEAKSAIRDPQGLIFNSDGDLLLANQNAGTEKAGEIRKHDGVTGAFLGALVSHSDKNAPFVPRGIVLLNEESLPMLIGAETVFVATADPKRSRIALLAENVGPELYRLWPTLIALRHENAAISYHMSHPDGPALMIEDIMPMSQWKRTAVFNEFYDQLGMGARLSLSLSIGRPDITSIVAHRAHGTFTERHRFILNLLGLHVSQACRTRKNCSTLLWRRFSGHWNQWSGQAS
jgi:hypothetical protein